MYMINLMIIYNVVNIFSMKNHKSSRKLRVGVNWYPGVNWSTTTRHHIDLENDLEKSYKCNSGQGIESIGKFEKNICQNRCPLRIAVLPCTVTLPKSRSKKKKSNFYPKYQLI